MSGIGILGPIGLQRSGGLFEVEVYDRKSIDIRMIWKESVFRFGVLFLVEY